MRGIRITAVVGAAAAIALTAAGGAGASTKKCPDDTLCVWSKKNYRGEKVKITKVNEVSNKLANEMNNEASSLKNTFDASGLLYDKKNGNSGDIPPMELCPGDELPGLGSYNDLASSSLIAPAGKRAKRGC